jgi:choline kinase
MAVTAVIVAAGRGSRLRAGCKPLAIVAGVTLLERALATVRAAGIRRYVVVVGSLDGPVASFRRRRRPDVELVCAPDHARGNGATVVARLARAGGRCLVMMVDHLREPSTLERVLAADGELVFAVDSRPAFVDPDDATLVRREHGAVVAIDKRLATYDAIEAGLAACSAEPLVELAAALHGELEFKRLKGAGLDAGHQIERGGHRRCLLGRHRHPGRAPARDQAPRGPLRRQAHGRTPSRACSTGRCRRSSRAACSPPGSGRIPSRSRTSACSCSPACCWRMERGRTCC